MSGFYKNNAFVYDSQKPYLIININSFQIDDKELNTSYNVLNKFYDITSNNEKIKFSYIMIFNTFSVNISNIKKVGRMFEKLRPKTKKQVYGTAIVINNNLKNLTGILQHFLKIFKNDNPVKFVTNVEDGKTWLSNLMKENVKE